MYPVPVDIQDVLDRFVLGCRADERVLAAFLTGSYARDAADAYSDLDLGVIVGDADYADFFASRAGFVGQLGEPIFLEDYDSDGVDLVFFSCANGSECELTLGRASRFTHIHRGPYRVLIDKVGILEGVIFTGQAPTLEEQQETLRRLIVWFWHDLSHHFLIAVARGQLWTASGALEDLRRTCVNIARLEHDFFGWTEGYEKVELVVPVEKLAPLRPTFGPLEAGMMLQTARVIVRYYRELAVRLAEVHGIPYPVELDRLNSARLDELHSRDI